MLLTITTTARPATDLGYLLHKRPDRIQSFPLSFGKVHVFYPEATPERTTAAMVLDIDPIALIRDRKRGDGAVLDAYVSDRPYVASSFLSVAIAQVFGSALAGNSRDRPELTEMPIPLEATVRVLPARGGEKLLRKLFEPLKYEMTIVHHPLDEQFPEWGESPYYTLTLTKVARLYELLSHLYVLIPVLDDEKHYWVGEDEVQKLVRHGEGWLDRHPEKELILRRYLKYQAKLVRAAQTEITEPTDGGDRIDTDELGTIVPKGTETAIEEKISLHEVRLDTVMAAIRATGAKSVLDLGCGEGKLLRKIAQDPRIERILGMDVSTRALEIAEERLRRCGALDVPGRLRLIQGSLSYRDSRLEGFDTAAMVEVVEHLDPHRLEAMQRVVLEIARPKNLLMTTPNREYNIRFAALAPGKLRHADHRFEWTRDEFRRWCESVVSRFGYRVTISGVGPDDPEVGAPSQMAIFTRD